MSFNAGRTFAEIHLIFRHFKEFGGSGEDLLAHQYGCGMDGRTGDGSTATGESACSPVEMASIACDDSYILYLYV